MKKTTLLAILIIIGKALFSQTYSEHFTREACRIDFMLCGNFTNKAAHLVKIKKEPFWGGRQNKLSESLNLGEYRFQVFDSLTHQLLYIDGFSSLFFEWQTTTEALTVNKCFEQTIQFPYPLRAAKVIIDKRIDLNSWETLLEFNFSPADKMIPDKTIEGITVKEIAKKAAPEKAVDIVIIAEGYTAREQKKFFNDARKLADNLYTHEPFKRFRDRINVYAIAAVSDESGVSMPHKNQWKNTALGAHYYTFYEPRYLTSPNIFTTRDYAALVPYDAIYILVNTPEYGGGGIYNFYALASADSQRAQTEVVVHEFGHSFAGLGDEYFREGADVLDGMYDISKEPWEPNITSLVNFGAKWQNMLAPGTEVPTAVTDENKSKVGVYEGGGYLTKGMYRPMYDCRMRTNDAKEFCPVCQKSVERVIRFLTE